MTYIFSEYKKFIIENVSNDKNYDILLITLAFFLFLILFSIFYNIFIFYINKIKYKNKLLNLEREFILLKKNLDAGVLKIVSYKEKVKVLNKKLSELYNE